MGKGAKVIYMTIFLFLMVTILNGVVNEDDFEVFYRYLKATLILSPIVSMILINLWVYISEKMSRSQNVVWRMFRIVVSAIAWGVVVALVILLVIVFVTESDVIVFADTNPILFIVAVLLTVLIINIIVLSQKDS